MPQKLIRTPHRLVARLSVLWKKRFGVLPLRDATKDMADWFESPLGKAMLEEQQAILDESLNCIFGYHLMQIGVDAGIDLTRQIRISHKFKIHPLPQGDAEVGALADFNHLPLAAESIDAVILHHALDYTQSPHHLLRESARVLIPKGYMVIIGFNPVSLWGLGAYIGRWFSRRALWRNQYLRLGRLLDWLNLVDLEPVEIYQGFYRPPLPQAKAIKHLQWMEAWGKRWRFPWGGFYIILARKDHLAMTPIKPQWRLLEPLGNLVVPRVHSRKGFAESKIDNLSETDDFEKNRNIH